MSQPDIEFYSSVIVELEAKLAALEPQRIALSEALQSFRKLRGVAATTPLPNLPHVETTREPAKQRVISRRLLDFSLPRNELEGLTNGEASLKCIRLAGRPLATREIVNVMESSGLGHSSKNLWNTINTTLTRLEKAGKVKKTKLGWKLRESESAETQPPLDALTDDMRASMTS